MTKKLTNDIKPSSFDSAIARAPFDEAVDLLRASEYRVISTEAMYQLDKQAKKSFDKGYRHSLISRGNFVAEGIIAYRDEPRIIVAESPFLTDRTLLQRAIEASKDKKLCIVEGRQLYAEYYAFAEQELSKDPKERKACLVSPRARPPWFDIKFRRNHPEYKSFFPEVKKFSEEYSEDYQDYQRLLELSEKYKIEESFVCQSCPNLDIFLFRDEWLRKVSGTVVNQGYFVPLEKFFRPVCNDALLRFGFFLSNTETLGIRGIKPIDPSIFAEAAQGPVSKTYTPEEIIKKFSQILKEDNLRGLEARLLERLKDTLD